MPVTFDISVAETLSNASKKLETGISKTNRLSIERVEFYYKADEETRYLTLKQAYQSKTRGELPPQTNLELAQQAYELANVERPLTQWRVHGGPNPNIFNVKAHLYNQTGQAFINLPLTVTIRAKVGQLLVNPNVLLVDFDYLKQTATWENWGTQSVNVPAIAQGEDMLVPLKQFDWIGWQQSHPNQWPVEIEVSVGSPDIKSTTTGVLKLTPDHFLVPTMY